MIHFNAEPATPRRGRPPHDEVDQLRTRAWFAAVESRARHPTKYGLEKQFAEDSGDLAKPWQATGSWRAYAAGTRVPRPPLVARVEKAYPRTQVWLELILWELLRIPGPSLERIYFLLTQLRGDITELLFPHQSGPHQSGEAGVAWPEWNNAILRELDRMSDIEALTACMGLLREAEHRGNEYQHYRAALVALRIFLRLSSFLPLFVTAQPILNYLSHYFLGATYRHIPRLGPAAGGVNLDLENYGSHVIVAQLEDAGVLGPSPAQHRACLYLAEQYGLAASFEQLTNLEVSGGRPIPKSTPILRWFAKNLRSYTFTVSCLDGTGGTRKFLNLPGVG